MNGGFSPLEGFMGKADYEGLVLLRLSRFTAQGQRWALPFCRTCALTRGRLICFGAQLLQQPASRFRRLVPYAHHPGRHPGTG